MRALKQSATAVLVLVTMSGCATIQEREWNGCAIGGGVLGAAVGGVLGGTVTNNVIDHPSDAARGGAIGGGVVAGGALGALLGHLVCDPVKQPPPPPPPPPAAAPPPKHLVELEDVHFDFDKATLKPAGKVKLDEAVKQMKADPKMNVTINGYTDSIGSDAYNLKLSQRRATSAADYLASQGIQRSRLTTKGYGKSNPVASNATAEGRAKNRRVEVDVLK